MATGEFVKLQVLLPGETAAPGTASGKTGTPTAQTAGTAYSVTVNAVDGNWNLIDANDTVQITSSDANAALPANAALSGGTRTFSVTNKTAGSWTVTASDVTQAGITASTSTSFTVNPGAFTKLQLLVPGETAAPGTGTGKTGTPTAQNTDSPFDVTVNAVDANWNVVHTVGDTVAITASDPNASLPANAALSGGTGTFSVRLNTAGNWTVTATDVTDGSKAANTSSAIPVNLGAFAQLQVLLPGETAAPGTPTGKTGSPTAQTAGTGYTVTVNAVDANYNLINTNDTVQITSSDANAALPANAALSGGTGTFSVTNKTAGSWTVTASDVTQAGITASTSTSFTVNPGAFTKLQLLVPGETAAPGTGTGKTGTATAQNTDSPFDVTANAVDANWNVVHTVGDTVAITASDPNASLPANAALSGGTRTFSVRLPHGGQLDRDGDGRDRREQDGQHEFGDPGQSGGLCAVAGLAAGGDGGARDPDGQDGQPDRADRGHGLHRDRQGGGCELQPHQHQRHGADHLQRRQRRFAGQRRPQWGNRDLQLDQQDGGQLDGDGLGCDAGRHHRRHQHFLHGQSGGVYEVAIAGAGRDRRPGHRTGKTGTATAQNTDSPFDVTANAVDANWNVVHTVGDTVAITASDPSASLPANAALSGGTGTFSVRLNTAGNWTVTATDVTDGSKAANTSAAIPVNLGAFVQLQVLLPGETAAPGTPTGKTGSPTAQTAGTGYTVTVNAVDASYNLISTNDTVADQLQRRQRQFAGQRRLDWGNRDLQLDQPDGGQPDGNGFGCDAPGDWFRHQCGPDDPAGGGQPTGDRGGAFGDGDGAGSLCAAAGHPDRGCLWQRAEQ